MGFAPERIAEGAVSLEESNVFGGPTEFNTFDQNVPGFSVTFLLLGMLFGVGLGLLDEREWGMVYRLSASPVPPSVRPVSSGCRLPHPIANWRLPQSALPPWCSR